MKRTISILTFFFLAAISSCTQTSQDYPGLASWLKTIPNPRADSRWVVDAAGALDAPTLTELNALIQEREREDGTEIAIVILPEVDPYVPKEVATALFKHWGIGKKGKDNGLLILHALKERRVEFETGYGLEGVLPDITCRQIQQNITVPFFRAGRFNEGHLETLKTVLTVLERPGIKYEDLFERGISNHIASSLLGPIPARGADAPASREAAARFSNAQVEFSGEVAALRREVERGRFSRWLSASVSLGGLWILFWLFYRAGLLRRKDPKEKYDFITGRGERLVVWSQRFLLIGVGTLFAAWFPANALFILGAAAILAFLPLSVFGGNLHRLLSRRLLESLRDQPRPCPQCGIPMKKLDEAADDARLKSGQVAEERIHSMDYDVWSCTCGGVRIDKYLGRSPHDQCPKCRFYTQSHTRKVITEADYDRSGLALTTYTCKHCHHVYTRSVTLPRLVRSSSSSDSSGGSSSGGSFGGGSSGGGGSGSSY